jgi:hypothetical protein
MYTGIACGPQGARRVVCAFGWKGLEQQNESARLLGALAGQSRSKATAAPPSNDGGTSVSTASDAIYRACQVRPQCPLVANSGGIADVAALRICAISDIFAPRDTARLFEKPPWYPRPIDTISMPGMLIGDTSLSLVAVSSPRSNPSSVHVVARFHPLA